MTISSRSSIRELAEGSAPSGSDLPLEGELDVLVAPASVDRRLVPARGGSSGMPLRVTVNVTLLLSSVFLAPWLWLKSRLFLDSSLSLFLSPLSLSLWPSLSLKDPLSLLSLSL